MSPWPLDDPVPSPGLRPVNWSDTHADPPQVADLADEAWQRAVDRGISMERALAELQREAQYAAEIDRAVWGSGYVTVTPSGIKPTSRHHVTVSQQLLDDAKAYQQMMDDAWRRIREVFDRSAPVLAQMQGASDRQKGDQALADVKRAPLVPWWQWHTCAEPTAPKTPQEATNNQGATQ